MRTIVYVDGFNLYYGSLKRTAHKWLDLCAYFRAALAAPAVVQQVKYFTARVTPFPSNPGVAKRQDVYLRALRHHCGPAIQIIEGHYQVKPRTLPVQGSAPLRFETVLVPEEKGSDVNLAVSLVNDAWHDLFDCAAIVSNDSDLELSLSIVKRDLRKRVVLFTPGAPLRKPVARLTSWSHAQLAIDPVLLAASQLPDPIPGTPLHKPATW